MNFAGISPLTQEREEENRYGLMVLSMRVFGVLIRQMEKGD
jgi:hypothetical protein